MKITISENYQKSVSEQGEPCIIVNQDGSAYICCKKVNCIDENERNGRAVRVNTEGLSSEKIIELYKMCAPITWSGHVLENKNFGTQMDFYSFEFYIQEAKGFICDI